jgi:predicted ester cyclase
VAGEQDRNKEVVQAHFAALSRGDADGFASTHDPQGRNHAPGPFDVSAWPPEGKPFGPTEAREGFEWLRAGSPDLHIVVEDVLAERDRVVAWITMTGTQTGWRGPIPPTGRAFDFHHAHRFRLRDGLIVEHWAVRDDLRAMIQAGVITPPAGPRA